MFHVFNDILNNAVVGFGVPPPPPPPGLGPPPPPGPPGMPGSAIPKPPDALPHGLKPKKKWNVEGIKRANWKTVILYTRIIKLKPLTSSVMKYCIYS